MFIDYLIVCLQIQGYIGIRDELNRSITDYILCVMLSINLKVSEEYCILKTQQQGWCLLVSAEAVKILWSFDFLS